MSTTEPLKSPTLEQRIEKLDNVVTEIVGDLKTVEICPERIEAVASEVHAGDKWPQSDWSIEKIALFELIAASVNYCYWYGHADFRPNQASSRAMYALLEEAFSDVQKYNGDFVEQVNQFYSLMVLHRFPLIEDRARHLNELIDEYGMITNDLCIAAREDDPSAAFEVLMWLPGFAGDVFLKRAQLFLMMMYRKCGLFSDAMNVIKVPADYQVPRILRELGCMKYLNDDVDKGVLLPSGSRMEVEIRAATIHICDLLADKAGVSKESVDSYLWLRRKECTKPFHLTVTADY